MHMIEKGWISAKAYLEALGDVLMGLETAEPVVDVVGEVTTIVSGFRWVSCNMESHPENTRPSNNKMGDKIRDLLIIHEYTICYVGKQAFF